jgi:hypothetical protein
MDAVAAQHAFSKLNNHDRVIVMKRAAESSLHPLRIRNRVLRILEGYAASAENRNILMHSEILSRIGPGGDQIVQFRKFARNAPFRAQFFEPTADDLRSMADAMYSFADFGRKLYMHIAQNLEPAALRAEERMLPSFNLPPLPPQLAVLQPVP